jgi:DNA ligase-1
VFDVLNVREPAMSFAERNVLLTELLSQVDPCVKLVMTYTCTSSTEADRYYERFKSLGYEGMMYRDPRSPYGLTGHCSNKENRWKYLIKRKEWLDAEFSIVDFTLTRGDKGETGFQLTCETDDGKRFNVGSGLSDAELLEYEANPPLGQQARIRYEVLSDGGIPLKPTIEAIL